MALTNDKDKARFTILGLMSKKRKFAMEIGHSQNETFQEALEEMVSEDWIRLIDLAPIIDYPGKLFRIFIVTRPAWEWYEMELAAQQGRN